MGRAACIRAFRKKHILTSPLPLGPLLSEGEKHDSRRIRLKLEVRLSLDASPSTRRRSILDPTCSTSVIRPWSSSGHSHCFARDFWIRISEASFPLAKGTRHFVLVKLLVCTTLVDAVYAISMIFEELLQAQSKHRALPHSKPQQGSDGASDCLHSLGRDKALSADHPETCRDKHLPFPACLLASAPTLPTRPCQAALVSQRRNQSRHRQCLQLYLLTNRIGRVRRLCLLCRLERLKGSSSV
ncbi:hypothetical protein PHSY_002789 [Pseudozyma hubeiensis SY62]|uniref:Uncharacterized protein n=1 Tax=Pseudozyma hubeiensis (strain SY62) TaxID=1305764 RepID=R9P1W8_PSEHS|nr:hypothetical protein PHSY_002789 [Pseudozyma hubeiensis SY62]GAC95214.1 hypothetical protein PHSY_002789 [Pseudozyma hubeiensis SY62]